MCAAHVQQLHMFCMSDAKMFVLVAGVCLQVVDFPGVDFSMIQHQHDVEWDRVSQATCKNGCYFVGEQESAAEARALAFYRWLMSRCGHHLAWGKMYGLLGSFSSR